MQKQEVYILELLSGYLNNSLSKEKVQELFDLLSRDQQSATDFLNHPEIRNKLEMLSSQQGVDFPEVLSNRMRDRLLSAIHISEMQESTSIIPKGRVRNLWFTRVAAVAMILLIIAPVTYLFIKNKGKNASPSTQASVAISDFNPGMHKPVLTLSSGQQIVLDSSATKSIRTLSNTNIANVSSRELNYENATSQKLSYNTLTNPRGSTVITLTLSDGTKVWLNAGSSITYPTAFYRTNRQVEITGEAYFEVTKNPYSPFSVKNKNNDTKITVLGTHFNVNMYDDEVENKITLLEGSVNVTNDQLSRLLSPGEQALVRDGRITLAKQVNMESVMAWKNGQFILKGTDLAGLLRQISRWYDVDIENKNKDLDLKFGGSISRNVNLTAVVAALNVNGIKCNLNGKKLIVE